MKESIKALREYLDSGDQYDDYHFSHGYGKHLENILDRIEQLEAIHDDYIRFVGELDDNYIPKQAIRDKIEELKAKYNLVDDYWQYDYDVDMNTIDILKELLESEE